MCVCVCVCVRACVRACACACVCVYVAQGPDTTTQSTKTFDTDINEECNSTQSVETKTHGNNLNDDLVSL